MTNALRPAGTVVWVDLSAPDLDAARTFYRQLFGWTYSETASPMGRYVLASVTHGEVGGMMAPSAEDQGAGVPPSWTVVIGTNDLAATLARVTAQGGTTLEEPLAISDSARVAVAADPSGAVFGLMEDPEADSGIVWGAPGSVCWVECLSRDLATSQLFYEAVFDWKTSEDVGGSYVVFTCDGERVAGLMTMPDTVPAEAPSHWLVYFAVDDVLAATHAALDHGGTVLQPSREIKEGRFAILSDRAGAAFAVFEARLP